MATSGYVKQAWTVMTSDLGVLWGGFLLMRFMVMLSGVVVPLGGLLVYGPVQIGLMYVALQALRSEPYTFSDLFKGFDYFIDGLVLHLLISLISFFAWLCCLLPGFFLTPFFFYPFAFVIDKKMTATEAFKASWDLVSQNYSKHFVLFLLMILLNIIGLLMCCVGSFFTSVLTTIMVAVVYNDLVPREGVTPIESLAPPDLV